MPLSFLALRETSWEVKVQPGNAAAANTSSTGFCIGERVTQDSLKPAQTAARTSLVTPGRVLISYLYFYRHSKRALFFIIIVQLKFEVGMNIYCLHKSLWKTCRGLRLFDVHQRVIYDRHRADTCIRLLSQPPTVLSLLHLQSSGQLK